MLPRSRGNVGHFAVTSGISGMFTYLLFKSLR
jgi:hypothetical protein